MICSEINVRFKWEWINELIDVLLWLILIQKKMKKHERWKYFYTNLISDEKKMKKDEW